MTIDVAALVEALRQDPDQRVRLRQALLGDDADVVGAITRLTEAQTRTESRLAQLAGRVDKLAQAQTRTEARLDELAQAQTRTEARLDELAQAQSRTEARLDALTGRVDELAKDLRQLAVAQQRTERSLNDLVDVVKGMHDRLARLDGESYERRCMEKGHAYFQGVARRLRAMDPGDFAALVDDGRRDGRLSDLEADSLLHVDGVFTGRRRDDDVPVHLAVEASVTVDRTDIRRARERADLLARIVDTPVIAVVIGQYAPDPVLVAAQDADVWQVIGGRTIRPQEDLDRV